MELLILRSRKQQKGTRGSGKAKMKMSEKE